MRKRLKIIGIVLVVVLVLLLITSQRGGLGYLSPHTLQYTTQSERTFFITGIPFYRSTREQSENPVITMLIDEGFVSPQPGPSDRQEIIFHWNESWRDGYGGLYYVLIRNREDMIEWSLKNRELAEFYWTEGFRLLRSNDPNEILVGRYFLSNGRRYQDIEAMQNMIDLARAELEE